MTLPGSADASRGSLLHTLKSGGVDIPELRSAPAGEDVGLRQLLTTLASTHFVLTDEEPLLKMHLIRVCLEPQCCRGFSALRCCMRQHSLGPGMSLAAISSQIDGITPLSPPGVPPSAELL